MVRGHVFPQERHRVAGGDGGVCIGGVVVAAADEIRRFVEALVDPDEGVRVAVAVPSDTRHSGGRRAIRVKGISKYLDQPAVLARCVSVSGFVRLVGHNAVGLEVGMDGRGEGQNGHGQGR